MNNNPFQSHTWFGKLWNWLFGQKDDTVHYEGDAPESSRGPGSGNSRTSDNNRRPDSSNEYSDQDTSTFSPSSPSIFEGLFSGEGVLGNLISSLASRLTGAHLTGAEREANEFTAQQALINRQFESAEADKARQWQEDQYLKYNSPQALINQYAQAGINPALVAGGNMPAASTSTAAPAGNAGTSVSPSAPLDIVSSIISVLKAKAEIKSINLDNEERIEDIEAKRRSNRLGDEYDLKDRIVSLSERLQALENDKSDKAKTDAETARIQLENSLTEEFGRLLSALSVADALARIEKLEEESFLTKYERQVLGPLREALIGSETRKNKASAAAEEWANKFRYKYDSDPYSPPITQALTSLLEWLNSDDREKKREDRYRKQIKYRAESMTD